MSDLFSYHALNEQGKAKALKIANAFEVALGAVEGAVGVDGGRELALCRTHLEEACFYAKKAMAKQADNQEP